MLFRRSVIGAVIVAAGLFARAASDGSVIGWMRPNADASRSVVFLDAAGEETGCLCLYRHDFARAVLKAKEPGGPDISLGRAVGRLNDRADEWIRFAFTWDADGRTTYYVNGRSFLLGAYEYGMDDSSMRSRVADTVRAETRNGTSRGVTFVGRKLTAREVMEDYRTFQPVDLVIADSVVPPNVATNVGFRLAPGGTYQRPNPVEDLTNLCATVTVSSSVSRIVPDGIRSTFVPVEGGARGPVTVDVRGLVEIPSATVALEPGEYRLSVTFHGAAGDFVRNLFFTASAACDNRQKAATKERVRKGALLFSRTFAGPDDVDYGKDRCYAAQGPAGAYLELTRRTNDRVGSLLALPPSATGKPCLLEVDWPDDKERAFALFMFEEMSNSSRDHLQQGIVTGGVVPNSGRMQTTAFLYWPNTTNQLFEVRTVIKGRPGAIAAVRLYVVEEPLPKLKVRLPEGLPPRTFGHCDEDQTFDNNLTSQRMDSPTETVLPKLVDYFGYTGENAFHYSTMRYGNMYYGHAEGHDGNSLFPRRKGEIPETIRTLRRCGIEFVPQAFFAGDPAICFMDRIEGRDREEGREMLDREGRPCKVFGFGDRFHNIANPWEQDRFLAQFVDFLQEMTLQGVDRVVVCLENAIASPFCWPSLDCGYDAWTVGRFRRETGAADPEGEVWLAWRAKVVTEFFSKFCSRLRTARPDIRIVTEVSANPDRYASRGVDVEAIARIPNVELAVIRPNTQYWFSLFRGEGETDDLDRLYDLDSAEVARLRRLAGGSVPQVYSYPTYFEWFTSPVGGDSRFGNYFQNCDMHPRGRHYLREMAYAVGAMDALHYAIGMQPLGTLGNEDEVREFAQAYCALPAIPFADLPGSDDPVVARTCKTKNGTYVYAVNLHHLPVTAKFDVRLRALDLSTEEALETDEIALEPYQLRSFLVREGDTPTRVTAVLHDAAQTCYQARAAEIEAALAGLEPLGVDCSEAHRTVAAAAAAVADGKLARAHRLYFSLAVNEVIAKVRKDAYYLVPKGTPGNVPMAPYGTWETAANELADVLDVLPQTDDDPWKGCEVLVKPGVYYPTRGAMPAGSYRLHLTIRSCDPATGKADPEGTVFDGSRLPIDADGRQPRLLEATIFNWGWQIRGLTFRNVAAGGALRLANGCGRYRIADCVFCDNVVSNGVGGAVDVFGDSGTIADCVFRNNRAPRDGACGGALSLNQANDGKDTLVSGCTFEGNVSAYGGGAVRAWNGRTVISNCIFTGVCGGRYGSVLCLERSTCVRDCAFTNLTTVGGSYATVIGMTAGNVYEVSGCAFVDCTDGVQIFNLNGSAFDVRNTLFVKTSGTGQAPAWIWDGPMTFENCTIAGYARGHGWQNKVEAETASYVNCILPSRANCDVRTVLENAYVTAESGDPFVSLLRGDCRLAKGTACIDGGRALAWHAGATDVGGRRRVVGAAVDIGCYERQPEDPARYYYRAVQSAADKTGRWTDATVGLQEAIDAAPAGAFVGIRSGTWNVARTITVYGKSLTLCGLNAETDEIDRDGTILDGGRARRIMQVTNRTEPVFDIGTAEGVVLGSVTGPIVVEGLTFRNGDATAGTTTDAGGVIRDADGHRTSPDGGGLWMRGQTGSAGIACPRVRNCRFVGNAAASGGGLYLNWGGVAEDCVFEANEAKTGTGGGLCGHDWAGPGGTIERDGGWANPYALRCTFLRNAAAAGGGGYGDSAGFCYFRIFAKDCVFRENRTDGDGGNFAGGHGSIVEGCTFADGSAGGHGANFVMKRGGRVSGCTFTGGSGGSVLGVFPDDQPVVFADCVISNLTGGIFIQGAVRFRNVLMADVRGDCYIYYPDSFKRTAGGEYLFENCTFADCAHLSFSSLHRAAANLSAVLVNTIVDCPLTCGGRHADGSHVQALAATNCCFRTLPTEDDTIRVDAATCFAASPGFVDAAAGDYSLRADSPCRDRGRMLDWMTAESKDLSGNPRVISGGKPLAKNPAALPDIGCYEEWSVIRGLMIFVR